MPRDRARTFAARLAISALAALALLAGCASSVGQSTAPVSHVPAATATVPPLVWRQATLPEGFTPPGPANHFAGFAISPADGRNAWACAPVAGTPGSFTIWATRDTAATWQTVSTLAPQEPETPQSCQLSADPNDVRILLVTLNIGTISTGPRAVSLLSTDGGAHWQQLPGEVTAGLVGSNSGAIYAFVGDTTTMGQSGFPLLAAITSVGGALQVSPIGLSQLNASAHEYVERAWTQPPDPALYAYSSGGSLWQSTDGGAHWALLNGQLLKQNVFGRWLAGSRHWLFCASRYEGSVTCSTDGGAIWQQRPALPGCPPASILPDGSLLAICADLSRLAPGSTTWQSLGTAPYGGTTTSGNLVVTATGQIWAFAPGGGAPWVAVLPG